MAILTPPIPDLSLPGRRAVLMRGTVDSEGPFYSQWFTIPPGIGFLIFATGFVKWLEENPPLPDDWPDDVPDGRTSDDGKVAKEPKAVIERVVLSIADLPDYCSCCDNPGLPTPVIDHVEDVTQCGDWHLDRCQNQGILAVPGTFRVRLDDPAPGMEVYIEIISIGSKELANIPGDLFFGNVGCC